METRPPQDEDLSPNPEIDPGPAPVLEEAVPNELEGKVPSRDEGGSKETHDGDAVRPETKPEKEKESAGEPLRPEDGGNRGSKDNQRDNIGMVANVYVNCGSGGPSLGGKEPSPEVPSTPGDSTAEEPLRLFEHLRKIGGKAKNPDYFNVGRDCGSFESQEKRFLKFITCYYHEPALDIAHAFIECCFKYHQRYYLNLPSADEGYTFDLLQQVELLDAEPRVVLVELREENDFLKSFKSETLFRIDDIEGILKSNETIIVCVLTDQLLEDGLDETALSKEAIGHWKIDFVTFVLRQAFDRQEAQRLARYLERQRREGRWPEADSDFYLELWSHWKSGAETLRRQIELRRTEKGLIEAQPVRAEEIFPRDFGVEQLALCTAVFFRGLSPRNFHAVFERILDGEEIEVEESEVVEDDEGVAKTITKKVPRQLSNLWQEAPDEIMQRCGLIHVEAADGGGVIGFEQPYLRSHLRQFINRRYSFLVTKYFAKVEAKALVFDPGLSEEVTQKVIHLVVERALEESSYYNEDWLIHSFINVKALVQIRSEQADDPEKIAARVLEYISKEATWNHFCRRSSSLIREMLKHPELEESVVHFLHFLLRSDEQNATLQLVLHIARNLRFVRRFDALYWLRLLLDQGRQEIRDRTYTILQQQATGSGGRVYDFLEGIHEWLPDDDRKSENYSMSQVYGLRFIMDLTMNVSTGAILDTFTGLSLDSPRVAPHLSIVFRLECRREARVKGKARSARRLRALDPHLSLHSRRT